MIKKIISSLKLSIRVIKNLIQRPFRIMYNKFIYFFNAGKLVNKFPGMARKLPKILKTKPEKREDYYDWGSIYVAKSLVLIVVVLLIAIPLLFIFLLWPALVSWFFVRSFYTEDADLGSYNGRVLVYYDQEFETLKFEGRLSDGNAVEYGLEYYEGGRLHYAGDFAEDMYEGSGILYYEDGTVKYRGDFSRGIYSGVGELIDEDGTVYSGTFEKGKLQGSGTIEKDETLYYSGNFEDGEISGSGKILYADGKVKYSGTFKDGALYGSGQEYYETGVLKYNGEFISGLPHGAGTLYGENGKKLYSGDFEMGNYCGEGTLYCGDGTITGTFENGEITGTAVKTFANGLKYEGCFESKLMNGTGTLSDITESFSYAGDFLDDDFDFSKIVGCEVSEVKAMFNDKLTEVIADDCFYLENKSFGVCIKCSFANENSAAKAIDICLLPFLSAVTIKSAADINAPSAVSVSKKDVAAPAAWIVTRLGVTGKTYECYQLEYDSVYVSYWVDAETKVLVYKEAVKKDGTSQSGGDGGNASTSGMTDDDIRELFEELGLNVEDFRSLGF